MTRQTWLAGLAVTGLLACGAPVPQEAVPITQSPQDIRNGDDAYLEDFPYHARILRRGVTRCQGALVKPGWVLTSAHCLQGATASELAVVTGEVRLDVTEPTQQTRSVMRWIAHPSYEVVDGAPLHDVALVQVAQPFITTGAVTPIALPTMSPDVGTELTVTGWGTSGAGNPPPESHQLKHATMPVVGNASCAGYTLRNPVYDAELCMSFYYWNKGACVGDEGAPLALGGALYGVMSWDGTGGCNLFTIFTDVANYVTWIRSFTG